jgi:anti-sigma B factor antagonist
MSDAIYKHLVVQEVNGVALVDFVQSELIYASEEMAEINKELRELVSVCGYKKIILSFRNVQYLSSMMLVHLLRMEQQVKQADGWLRICNLGPFLMDTLKISHLERVFSIYEDVDTAIQDVS